MMTFLVWVCVWGGGGMVCASLHLNFFVSFEENLSRLSVHLELSNGQVTANDRGGVF